jgi:DNA-binding response OmpR family regulator
LKILFVEDSERLRNTVAEGLRRSGFSVDIAEDGERALAFASLNQYDIVVLDLMLPKLDGYDVLRKLRRDGNSVSILILSAKDQVDDRIKGLELGADDFLVKPFSFDELVARIRALVRRACSQATPVIDLGDEFEIEMSNRRANLQGVPIGLTPSEYCLLECLALRRGQILSKDQLIEKLYDSDTDIESNVVEVLISNTRKKLRRHGAGDVIKTERGFGYYVE